MQSQIKLGRVSGIKIGLHYSWFLIAFLIVVSLNSQFRVANPEWGAPLTLVLALMTAVLFFVSLLVHELSHSLFAKAHGLPVREITLFALGGVSQIEKNPVSAKTEFWMALAGPLASAAIGGACLAMRGVIGSPTSPAFAVVSWLGYINVALAGFNLIPGYPLDGGRILRAAIWWKTGNAARSTLISARVGQAVGGVFIALGVVQFFGGAGFSGLWIAFIGWFLLQAASESYFQVGLKEALKDVTVADVMTRDCVTVDGNLNIQQFVDEWLLKRGNRCFIVLDNDGLAGLITPAEVRAIERTRWQYTTVFDAMRPVAEARTVRPETPLQTALEIMGKQDLNQLPVVADGRVVGMFSRGEFVNFLKTRAELQA